MITFEIDGEFLDLSPDFSVPIEWESSLFSDEFVLNGISTLPIAFPFTAKNKRLLRYFNLIENDLRNLQLDCKLHLANNLWCTGQITVAVKGETFDCDFSEVTPLALSADKKLVEILNEDITYIIDPFNRFWVLSGDYSLSSGTISVKFYVNNDEFTFTVANTYVLVTDVDTLYNAILAEPIMMDIFRIDRFSDAFSGEELIKLTVDNADTIDSNVNIGIERLDGIAYVTSMFGVVPDWTQYQHDSIKNKLDADVDKIWPDAKMAFPTLHNPDFYGDNNLDYSATPKCLNFYQNGYLGGEDRYCASPQLFIGYLLQQLSKRFGLSVNGTFTELSELYNRILVYNNRAIDLIGADSILPIGVPFNFWQGKFITGDHCPDATLKELFTSICKYYSVGIFIRNGVISFNTKNSILASTEVIDWTLKQFRIYNELKGTFDSGFKITYSTDSNDSFLSDSLKDIDGPFLGQFTSTITRPYKGVKAGSFVAQKDNKSLYRASIQRISGVLTLIYDYVSKYCHDYLYLTGEKEIPTLASQTLNNIYTQSGYRQMLLPRINQEGASYEYNLGSKNASLRYLLYWGLQCANRYTGGSGESETFAFTTDDLYKYPMAQMDNLGIDGSILGDYKLRFEDEDGIVNQLHKNWLDFLLRTKKLTINILLDTTELLQLDLSKKIQLGPSQFFISKISTTLNNNSSKVECLIDLYKI